LPPVPTQPTSPPPPFVMSVMSSMSHSSVNNFQITARRKSGMIHHKVHACTSRTLSRASHPRVARGKMSRVQ
jgi:hypothetical protein